VKEEGNKVTENERKIHRILLCFSCSDYIVFPLAQTRKYIHAVGSHHHIKQRDVILETR
jgi:hypothetical protein